MLQQPHGMSALLAELGLQLGKMLHHLVHVQHQPHWLLRRYPKDPARVVS